MTSKPALDAKGFEGVVITMDWVRLHDGRMYTGIKGKVSIYSAEEAVGFVPTGHNSANWLARVEGPTSSVTLMGCQVRLVIEGHAARDCHADVYEVP